VNLHMRLACVSSEKYLEVGQVIRSDFIDLSAQLEKKAFRFFTNDVHSLQLSNLEEWHKYQRPETVKRLNQTALFIEREKIQRIAQADYS